MSTVIANTEAGNAANGNLKDTTRRKSSIQNGNVNGDVHQNKSENGTVTRTNGVNIADECDCKFSTTGAHDLDKNQSARQTEVVEQAPNVKAVSATGNGTLTERRKSLQKMSTMEQESLLEKEHLLQIRSCSAIIHSDVKYTRESFRRLFLSEELQEHLFKLFDQDNDGKLIQEDWIEFLKIRLTEKHTHFIEHLESVVYCRCGDEPVTINKFCEIFKTKGIVENIYKIIDHENAGSITAEQIMEFLASITTARPHTGFDKGSLERLEKVFKETVGNEKEIRKEDFTKIVNSKNPFFTKRVFDIFDRDHSGSISFQEFLDAMHQFSGKSPEDKIKFLFRVYDLDGDGLIQRKELQDVMTACMHENGMKFSPDQLEDLTSAMIEDAGTNNRDAITYEALKNQLEKHGGLLENLSISIDRWLLPAKPKPPTTITERIKKAIPHELTISYMKNNYEYVVFLAFFIIVNVALFTSRIIEYYDKGPFMMLARACGQCLNFNCTFILILMLRQSITYLRSRGWSTVLPLDSHIHFHKQTGYLIVFYSILHTIMHCFNLRAMLLSNSDYKQNDSIPCSANHTEVCTAVEFLFTDKPGFGGLTPGIAFPTGIVLMLILAIIFICSQPFVRRAGSFQVFYWTHTLYIPFWILLILHCKNFWKWFILPGTIFAIERLIRFSWIKSGRGNTYITSGVLLSSKVVNLQIKRPAHFDFHSGDYVFVNIPAIAQYEWHPFTISSAPEQDDSIWLHIRAVGEWTNKLFEYFRIEQEKLEAQALITEANPQTPPITATTEAQSPIKRFQATVKRTFSKKDDTAKPVQLIGFNHRGFNYENRINTSVSEGDLNNSASCSIELYESSQKIAPEKKLNKLFSNAKAPPLSKSLSMPDMQTKNKKKERSLVLKDYMRSESEKSFDESQIKKARLRSLCIMYMSQHNKSLAQSFRYMRNKPTIIAFKTPSMEKCDPMEPSTSHTSPETSISTYSGCPEKQAEEGHLFPIMEMPKGATVNYPVGKPLGSISERATPGGSKEDILSELPLKGEREIILDGPYGAPSSHIFRAQHAVLIATGIGVTPFASILQSIMFRYWKARHTCPNCNHCFSSDIPRSVMNLKKVDFFWINRNQESFEWFISLLSKLEIEQAELGGPMERFLDMHMYITSALQKSDMKAVGLQLALDLLHQKEKRDLITGLKTRTNAGRPNWDKVFNQISKQKKGKVTVFFCGPPQIGRDLQVKCNKYGYIFRKEVF